MKVTKKIFRLIYFVSLLIFDKFLNEIKLASDCFAIKL